MRILSVYFVFDKSNLYDRLARVWEYSAKKHNPDARVELKEAPPLERDGRRKDSWNYNDYKLQIWVEELKKSDEPTIVMDADMLVIGDMSGMFDQDFDICYTARTKTRSRFAFNGGVLAFRPSAKVFGFLERWAKQDAYMYANPAMHMPFRTRYGGMNQASFGYMLERDKHGLKIVSEPCLKYNLCDEEWHCINDETKAIHIKGNLRRAVFGAPLKPGANLTEKLLPCYNIWKRYEWELYGGDKPTEISFSEMRRRMIAPVLYPGKPEIPFTNTRRKSWAREWPRIVRERMEALHGRAESDGRTGADGAGERADG